MNGRAVFEGRAEPALVARILNDMGSGADQLPLMQHALMRLWKGSQGNEVLTLAAMKRSAALKGTWARPTRCMVHLILKDGGSRR